MGSGKSGTPLARMHWANFTCAASGGACGDGWPPRKAFSAASSYLLHGPVLPWASLDSAADTFRMVMWMTLLASMVGSVWLGSP